MVQSIPVDVQQLAGAYQLGAPLEEYRFKPIRAIFASIFFLLLGVGFIAFIVATGSLTTSLNGDTFKFLLFIVLGLFMVGVGVWSGITTFRDMSLRVIICADGLLRVKRNQVEIIRWDQVEAMWQAVTKRYVNGVYTGTTHLYTVHRADGATFKFNDNIRHVEALGNSIQREVTRKLLPHVISAYNMGSTVTFGTLSVNQQGISNSKEMLPWGQFNGIQVNRGIVTVKKEGKWLNWSTVRVPRIPNFYVFMALVDYAAKGRR